MRTKQTSLAGERTRTIILKKNIVSKGVIIHGKGESVTVKIMQSGTNWIRARFAIGSLVMFRDDYAAA